MSVEKFDPRDPKYKKVSDLPEEQQGNYEDFESGGFVRKGVIEKSKSLYDDDSSDSMLNAQMTNLYIDEGITTVEKAQRDPVPRFKLSDLLTYQNPNIDNINAFIREEGNYTDYLDCDWTSHWLDDFLKKKEDQTRDEGRTYADYDPEEREELMNFFKEKLKGNILVDLGCGRSNDMSIFAGLCEAKAYIGVDKHVFRTPRNEDAADVLKDPEKFSYGRGDIEKIYHLPISMLEFLAHLESNSVCVTMNGIDRHLIPNDHYHMALARELNRVVKKDGILFGAKFAASAYVSDDYFSYPKLNPKQNFPILIKKRDWSEKRTNKW